MASTAAIAEEELDYEGLGEHVPYHINMVAGAAAGIAEHAFMFPVDVVRTRMQVLSSAPTATYSGIGEALRRISTLEGVRALWRGVSSVIMGAGPAHALYFGTYEVIKQATGGNEAGHQFASTAISGASATVAADAFMNPFDVIKQRMQMHSQNHHSFLRTARSIYQHEGLRAFYLSYPTTLTMTVPFTAVQFTTYESAKEILNPSGQYSPASHIAAGAAAGAVAAALTNPLDVCKTLLQTRGTSTDPVIRQASGMSQAFRIIIQREGLKGFTRGLAPRVLTNMPSNALCFLSYEGFRFALSGRHQKD